MAGSFNGRTGGFDPLRVGSNPTPAITEVARHGRGNGLENRWGLKTLKGSIPLASAFLRVVMISGDYEFLSLVLTARENLVKHIARVDAATKLTQGQPNSQLSNARRALTRIDEFVAEMKHYVFCQDNS